MQESIIHYLHVAPLFIIIALSIANQVFKSKKFYSYLRKNHVGLQLLLVSVGVMSGAISHSHYGILECNLCFVYSAILAWSAMRLLSGSKSVANAK
jgi:uncharacterized membrane protein